MKRISAAIAAFLFVVLMATPAQAADNCTDTTLGPVCLSVDNGKASVTGPGISLNQDVPVPAPVIVPGPVVNVPVPGPVVKVPGPTVYVPGPTRVITKVVPGPTRTVEVPGPTQTVTVPGPTRMLPCPTPPVTEKTVTVKTPGDTHYIKVSVPQVVAFSLLALILGPILVLLVMYIMYRIGRSEGEHSLDDFLRDLRDLARGR